MTIGQLIEEAFASRMRLIHRPEPKGGEGQ
jgi:hypothetical protein